MNKLLTLILLIPLVAVAQYKDGGRVTGNIIARYSDPEVKLAHPLPSPDGKWIAATTRNYRGIHLISMEDGAVESGRNRDVIFHRLFTPDNRFFIYILSGPDRSLLMGYDFEGPVPILLPRAAPLVKQLLLSKKGRLVLHHEKDSLTVLSGDDLHHYSGLVTICYHDGDRLYFQNQGETITVQRQSEGTIITAVPSPDFTQVVFQEAGRKLYLWDIKNDEVQYMGQGEMPSWSPDGSQIVAMITEDDGHRLLTSHLRLFDLQGKSSYDITMAEPGIYMEPHFLGNKSIIVAEDRQTGTIVTIELE